MIVLPTIKLALIISVCALVGVGCKNNNNKDGNQLADSGANGGPSKEIKSIVTGIRGASAVTLYEGLPHQMFEREELKQELASKTTVRLHDFPFYKETLVLSEADEKALRDVVCAGNTFEPVQPGTMKMCGGFHPDYCVEWRGSDGKNYRVLFCFGCHEADLGGPTGEVRCDVNNSAFDQMETILKPYRKNRPIK